jgi:hypothetical protein
MANKTAPANETKALVERAWLWYTPVWCAVTGGIMVGGWANEAMGDAALFLFGLSMAVGLCAAPFAYRRWTKRGAATALDGRVVWAMIAANVVLSFGMNYFQTPFFFDVLHMHYGFKTTWRIERNPVFLYLLTMPYFATYTVCCCRTARLISRSVRVSWLRRLLLCLLPFTFAFIETLTHVNPLTEQIFCYDDLGTRPYLRHSLLRHCLRHSDAAVDVDRWRAGRQKPSRRTGEGGSGDGCGRAAGHRDHLRDLDAHRAACYDCGGQLPSRRRLPRERPLTPIRSDAIDSGAGL